MSNGTIVNQNHYSPGTILEFPYPCGEEKHTCSPYLIRLSPGHYHFEVFGAEGGRAGQNRGGLGGFSKGDLILQKTEILYLFVGALGITTQKQLSYETTTAFNGGGIGQTSHDRINASASSGGGASDIRIQKPDLFHRLIVAGGGGGTGFYNEKPILGGNGGGINGQDGHETQINDAYIRGRGASQTGSKSLFGKGQNRTDYDGCGGGGGWYGGTSGRSYCSPGGGGSGFVFTKENQDNATQAGLLLTSEYYLSYAETYEMGDDGHTGDGLITIKVLKFFNQCITLYFHFSFHLMSKFFIINILFS